MCVPFSSRAQFAPDSEFTDAKIKAKFAACKADSGCREKLARIPPLSAVPGEMRVGGTWSMRWKLDPHGVVDLKRIRRPGYFARSPYEEPIAEAEGRTWTVEFHVPREAYERLKMNRTDPVALRGWYIEGAGVLDGKGVKSRALVVLIGGRAVETTATQAPDERPYDYDELKAQYVPRSFPSASSEQWGAREWRNLIYEINRAGFDVLTFDKRGHGISGGYNAVNTLEQGRDMWRALDALETGGGRASGVAFQVSCSKVRRFAGGCWRG